MTDPKIELRAINGTAAGLGLPLPAGPVALFERQDGRELLIGESSTEDKAVGEEVEIGFDGTANVTAELRNVATTAKHRDFEMVVRNANPFAVRYEADFQISDRVLQRVSAKLARKNGRDLWAVTVPANGSMTLNWRTRPER